MITFLDEKDVEHGALATIKVTNAVNGERSLTGEIESGDYVLSNIERGWRLRFDDEFYVVTYAKPIDDGKTTHVTFDAVHQFFWDFDKSSVHEQLNDGSHTFLTYLDFIFTGSDYTYTIDPLLKVYAFEKQSFGYKSRLKLFNDVITSSGVEFQVNGKVVRILEKTGTDLSTVVRKNFNMNELGIEKNIGDFVTYQKGFGAWVDENDHTKGRLVTEYTSPLASVYGKLEAEPLVDERYTQADNMVAALKANVDNSYSISVRLDMEDLTRAGYDYTQPRAGDYIMAINETLDFQEKIRIVSFTSEYDVTGQLIKHEVTCNDIGAVKKLSASYSLTKEQAQSASATVVKAVEMANKALISADGKSTVYFGTEFPEDEPKGELHKGDSLYLTVGDTTKMYYWTGADWEELPIVNDVKAFQDQINDELKDIPDREEVESTINQKIATSKAEIKTQIDTAKSQAESNAKSYADEINQATAEVAEQANTAADALKTDLAKVKTDLTATTSTANSAKTSASEAKQQITTVANNLSKAKTDLTDSIAAVDSKADTIQSNVSKAQSDIQTVASNLTKAKQDLQTSINSVDSKADGIQSNLTKAKTDLQSSIAVVDGKADTVQANLTKVKSDLQASINTVEGKIPTEIGTVNLLKNSKAFNGSNITGVSTVLSETYNDCAVRYFKNTNENSARQDLIQFNNCVYPKLGGEYVASFWAKGSGELSIFFHGGQSYLLDDLTVSSWGESTTRYDGYLVLNLTEDWQRYWIKYKLKTAPASATSFGKHLLFRHNNNSTEDEIYLAGVQLEEGNIASGYAPNPEDTATQISNLSSQIQQTADGMTLLATKTELNSAKTELNTSIAAVNTKATKLQTDVLNLNASLSNTSKTVQAHATTLANQAEELQNQANQLTAQAEVQDALTTRVATVETTANGTKSTVSELSKTVASNTNNITSVTNRTKTVETDLTNAKTSISELQTNLSSTQTGLTNLTKRTKDVEDDLSGTKTTLTELSQTVADDGESITGLTTKTATIESSVNGLKTSLTNTQKDLTSVTTRTKNVEDDLAGTKTSLTSLSATVAADGQTITSLSNKTKTIESNVDGLTTSLSNTQKDLTSVTNRTKTVEDTLDGTRTELAELQETVDTTNSDLASVTQRTSTVESDLSGTKTSLSNLTKTVSDDGKTIASLSSQTKTIESTVNGLSTSLTSTQQDLAGITTRTKNVEDDLSGTKTELAELQTTVDTTNTDLANVTKRTKTVEDSLAGTKTSLSSLSQTVASNGQDITSLSSRTKTVEDSVSGLTTTMTNVQQTLTSTTSRTKAVEDNLNGTKTTLAQVQSTANANSQKTATLENDLDGLNAKFSSLRVGAVNLLKNSKAFKGSNITGQATLLSETYQSCAVRYFKNTNPNSARQDLIQFNNCVYPALGSEYVASFWAKGSGELSIFFHGDQSYLLNDLTVSSWGESTTRYDGYITLNLTDDWQRYWIKYKLKTAPASATSFGKHLLFRHNNNNTEEEIYLAGVQLEEGNIATDYSPNEADIEQKVADYKQTADQNYASLQSTVQALDGTVTANKATADQTAAGFKTRIESLETYQSGESTRANQYFESAKTETARQLTAERTAIANNYVAKSTYSEDVTGLRNDLTATTTTANTTKTNLASYQALNDQAVASLQSSLQTTDGNVSNLQTQINAVPGQITSAVSAVEGKIPSGEMNLIEYGRPDDSYNRYSGVNYVRHDYYYRGNYRCYALLNSTTNEKMFYTNRFKVERNTDYTLYFKGFADSKVRDMDVYYLARVKGSTAMWDGVQQLVGIRKLSSEHAEDVVITFNSGNYDEALIRFDNNGTTTDGQNAVLYFGDLSLKKGKSNSGWSPSLAELATANQISNLSSQIQQTADGMTLLATKTELNTAKSDLQSGISTATSKAEAAQSTANTNTQTISTHTTQISALNTGLQSKVSQSDFDSLSGDVDDLSSELTQTANSITASVSSVETKADNAQTTANSAVSKADSNAGIISTHTTQISVLNTGLSTKVSQSDFNTLSGRVTTAESNLTAKTNELRSEISVVEGKIPTSVGTVNLLKNTKTFNGSNITGVSTVLSETYNDCAVRYFKNTNPNSARQDLVQFNNCVYPKLGSEYVASFWAKGSGELSIFFHGGQSYLLDDLTVSSWGESTTRYDGYLVLNLTEDWQRYWIKYKLKTAPASATSFGKHLLFRHNNNSTEDEIYLAGVQLEEGNIVSGYTPNPEDYDAALTQAKSEIKQTTDSITASVSSVETKADNAQTTANSAVSKANAAQAGVNTLDSTTVKSASLTIGTDGVVMKAGKSTTDVANAIGSYFSVNQNAINLFSDKISVKGSMIVDGAITSTKIASKSINTAHLNGKIITADVIATGAITADAIKAGAVTTDKMTANSINGDRITAGTLDAAKIKAGSITASQIASGTITSSQIATGTISAGNIATGAITTDKIAANSINSDKIVSSGITANVIKGGKLQSLTNTTNFDLDTGKLFYNNNNTGVFRVEDGASTMGLKFSNTAITVNNTSRILSRVILGGDRRETTLDDGKWDQGGFTGIVAETINGVDSDQHAQADTLRVIGDNIYFTHSYNYDSLTSTSAQGWKMETFSPFSSYAGNVVLKPYGINYRQSDIITGDIRLDNGDGSGYWVRGCIRILRNCFQHYLNGGTSSGAMNAIRDALREISGV